MRYQGNRIYSKFVYTPPPQQTDRENESFIYVDTENCYNTLPHGSHLALLTFCDIATRDCVVMASAQNVQMGQIQSVIKGINKMRPLWNLPMTFNTKEKMDL
ncbi:hypothetical protein CRE_20500 [Caenorhabditis remanei]|uniref:Uncharacterized protein n=1 Tax=Caenorhabditis remanei TaxID=31234 RepID=E3N895_CAERE|nr:hypothetical protein CRE_20500 [Caenorhabditis remanei]